MTEPQSIIYQNLVNYNNGRGGRFMDVGARANPQETKVRKLYECGWTGVLVQGDSEIMAGLRAVYGNENRVQFLHYDISDEGSMNMSKLLSQYGNDIDLLNIDVDGNSAATFVSLPQHFLHKLKAICVKHEGNYEYIEEVLLSYSFRKVFLDNETLIMVK